MIKRFTRWVDKHQRDSAIPELEPHEAMQFLTDYLLGDNYYISSPLNPKQCNTVIVEDILSKYSKEYRKERKAYDKYQTIISR